MISTVSTVRRAAATHLSARDISPRVMVLLIGAAAIGFVALTVGGIVRAWDPLPYLDMWDGDLGFWYRLTGGDLGAMWDLWNVHRIVLARVAFVIDLAVFHGSGWFLIAANVAAALSIAAVFIGAMVVRLREASGGIGSRLGLALLAAVVIGLATSWVQSQNFLWGFQIQFFLGVLLPLASLVLLALARPDAPHTTARFAAALILALASVGTIASGLLAPFAAGALAVALRESRARIGILFGSGVGATGLYLIGYFAQPHTDALQWFTQPLAVAEYVLLYLGGPVSEATGSTLVGGLSVVVLLAILAASAWRWLRGRDPSRMAAAMLVFAGFVLVGAVVTAFGRLDFGTLQATAGRYSTPVLAAWAAAVVLVAPSVQTAFVRRPRRAAVVLALIVIGLVLAQASVMADVGQLRFRRQFATLAIALGVPDGRAISAVYPGEPARAVELGQRAMRDGLTVLADPPYRNLSAAIGTRDPAAGRVTCDTHLRLRATIPGSGFVRLEGEVLPLPAVTVADGLTRILDTGGRTVGFAVFRQPQESGSSAPSPFIGYMVRHAAHQKVRFAGTEATCMDTVAVP